MTIMAAGRSYGEYDAVNGINSVTNAWHRFKATQDPPPSTRSSTIFAKAYRAAIKRYGVKKGLGNGFQIVVSRGTLKNPSKRRSLISKIRKILSNPGGVALDVLGPAMGAGYAESGAKGIMSLYGGGRKRKSKSTRSKLKRKRR